MYASINIKQGEELFITYGSQYWCSQYAEKCKNPFLRTLCEFNIAMNCLKSKQEKDCNTFLLNIQRNSNIDIY